MPSLPAYDLPPGRENDELIINLILYGMVLALVLAMAWVLIYPFAQGYLERRRNR
jgi:hypothetical protein